MPSAATLLLLASSSVAGFQLCRHSSVVLHPPRCCRAVLSEADSGQPRPRNVEVCHLNEEGKIDECEVVSEDELPKMLGLAQATKLLDELRAQVKTDAKARRGYQGGGCLLDSKEGQTLVFGVPSGASSASNAPSSAETAAAAGAEAEGAEAEGRGGADETFYTLADWSVCLDEQSCEVPDDVLLRALGPDRAPVVKRSTGGEGCSIEAMLPEEGADHPPPISDQDAATPAGTAPPGCPELKPRFHLHFGAGRLGMGLVVPAISSSGIPFAVVQRPKPRCAAPLSSLCIYTRMEYSWFASGSVLPCVSPLSPYVSPPAQAEVSRGHERGSPAP